MRGARAQCVGKDTRQGKMAPRGLERLHLGTHVGSTLSFGVAPPRAGCIRCPQKLQPSASPCRESALPAGLPRVWGSQEVVGDFCRDWEGFDHRPQAGRPHQTRAQSRQGHLPAQGRVAANACGQHQRLSVWGGPRGAAHTSPGGHGRPGGDPSWHPS